MPSNQKGHIVQIWRPVTSFGKKVEWVDMNFGWWGGNRIPDTASPRGRYTYGWRAIRREGLNLRQAIKLAKACQRAGFDSRVLFLGVGTREVVATFPKKS